MSKMSEDNNKQYSHDLIFATTMGVGLVCLIAKYRRNVLRFKKVNALLNPLGHQNAVVVNTIAECQNIVKKLRSNCEAFRVLGFDCEWVTVDGSRRRVALLQLASKDGLCALIRICKLNHIPVDLKNLLEDESILKVGVAPSDDAKYLFQDYGVCVQGCLDLRHLMTLNGGKTKGGLAGLSENVLGVVLDKNWRVRCSDWEADILTEAQRNYAARDALVGVEIFSVLLRGRVRRDNYFWECCYWKYKMNDNIDSKIKEQCKAFVDVKFKFKHHMSSLDESKHTPNLFARKSHPVTKQARRAFMTRQNPMYDNCYMQAPDGEVLCTCDQKKAEWYVLKGLASVVTESPYTVRLNFEPSGRGVDEAGEFYKQEKKNLCVVCGATESFLRKNIVPHEYRKYFPNVMKEHTSHDVLLLCLDCHLRSNYHDAVLRRRLAIECNAPLGQTSSVKVCVKAEEKQVYNAAKALRNTAHTIPQIRRQELEQVVLNYYKDATEITPELLKEAVEIDFVHESSVS